MNNIINDKKFNDIMNRIQSKRIELKLSYQDLANKTGLSKSTLQRYETGSIRNIPLDKLEILANALEVSPMWIIGYDIPTEKEISTKINLDDKTTLLLNSFNKLNDEGKNEAIKRVDELTELNKYKKEEDNRVIELPKKEKQIWEEPGKEHLMPIACHDDNLTDEEKAIVNEKINEILNNLDKY
ncbi:helix-turn-helix domain-containing protein [Clostridium tertium]|jgi:transcriptional regulator with XRE-family HTH domain|uniref:helix-turn-helix domain-containing protein n=1 Tax=Clostridium tertium TaxID=1559 RepID=UPI002A82D9DC|nr:helix-turn-helix domain-containing protein [Clostridium tertium]MDY4606374.1 helix-turn-helix domain-containing protein [Clostridium tertium]